MSFSMNDFYGKPGVLSAPKGVIVPRNLFVLGAPSNVINPRRTEFAAQFLADQLKRGVSLDLHLVLDDYNQLTIWLNDPDSVVSGDDHDITLRDVALSIYRPLLEAGDPRRESEFRLLNRKTVTLAPHETEFDRWHVLAPADFDLA